MVIPSVRLSKHILDKRHQFLVAIVPVSFALLVYFPQNPVEFALAFHNWNCRFCGDVTSSFPIRTRSHRLVSGFTDAPNHFRRNAVVNGANSCQLQLEGNYCWAGSCRLVIFFGCLFSFHYCLIALLALWPLRNDIQLLLQVFRNLNPHYFLGIEFSHRSYLGQIFIT